MRVLQVHVATYFRTKVKVRIYLPEKKKKTLQKRRRKQLPFRLKFRKSDERSYENEAC